MKVFDDSKVRRYPERGGFADYRHFLSVFRELFLKSEGKGNRQVVELGVLHLARDIVMLPCEHYSVAVHRKNIEIFSNIFYNRIYMLGLFMIRNLILLLHLCCRTRSPARRPP